MLSSRIFSPHLLFLLVLVAACTPEPEVPMDAWRRTQWILDFEQGLTTARHSGRPVFIYFTASWCSWCHQYERDTLSDPRVRHMLQQHYVSVLIDFDGRPDLSERLRVGGLPYSAVLTNTGDVALPIVGIVSPQDLGDLLEGAATTLPSQEITETLAVTGVHDLGPAGLESFRKAYLEHLDTLYEAEIGTLAARFETGAGFKRPAPRSWRYLLQQGLWPKRIQRAATVEAQRLRDSTDGGFFYFLDPHREDYLETSKLLEANAWLMAWFAEAGMVYNDETLIQVARSGLAFLRNRLWEPKSGGFYQAQIADRDYYDLPARERRSRPSPAIMQALRTDTNAQAVIALVATGKALQTESAYRMAEEALNFILTGMFHQDRLYHIREQGHYGSLVDRPADWFWTLAAANAVATSPADALHGHAVRAIHSKASAW
ncbi:MAG: DUF255 domain-containing protein, partial [Halobacteria archaeon]|nr:DUF255 domain-containing protein [Halobacteria archaeon]